MKGHPSTVVPLTVALFLDCGMRAARLPPVPDGGATDSVDSKVTASGAEAGRPGNGSSEIDGAPADAEVHDSVRRATAVAARTFLDSFGVCAHVAQGIDAPGPTANAMAYAGIRNLRDDGSRSRVDDWIAMHASAGVRVCLLTDRDVDSTIDMATRLNAAGALLAVEGPNEPNNFPVTYEGQTSSYRGTFAPVAKLQRDLYAAVKAASGLKGIPVFHSSEAGGSEPDDVGLQFLTIPAGAGKVMSNGTIYADYANIHNYVCGHDYKLVDNVAWNASSPTLSGDWDGLFAEYSHTWHGGFAGYPVRELGALPKVTTETGWLTSGPGAITEEQQGRLLMNLYLSAYKRGFAYTFIYMLRDDPGQGIWGLFDVSYKPKRSGTYLHNLTTILSDEGVASSAGALGYRVADEPETVHDLLLQKRAGAFELVLWDERPSGGSDRVTVDLGTVRPTVNVYDPTVGTAPMETLRAARAVSLTLTDHPVVLEL